MTPQGNLPYERRSAWETEWRNNTISTKTNMAWVLAQAGETITAVGPVRLVFFGSTESLRFDKFCWTSKFMRACMSALSRSRCDGLGSVEIRACAVRFRRRGGVVRWLVVATFLGPHGFWETRALTSRSSPAQGQGFQTSIGLQNLELDPFGKFVTPGDGFDLFKVLEGAITNRHNALTRPEAGGCGQ